MKLFAIICLTVIMITVQHLINWGWRKIMMDDRNRDAAFPIIVIFMVALMATFAMGLTLAKWIIEFQYGVSIPECFQK